MKKKSSLFDKASEKMNEAKTMKGNMKEEIYRIERKEKVL